MSQEEHYYRLLKSGRQIVNVDAKWTRDKLYVLFAGRQYMDISGREAEMIWHALSRLSIDATAVREMPRDLESVQPPIDHSAGVGVEDQEHA